MSKKDKRLKPIDAARKTHDIHIRLKEDEYIELRTRANNNDLSLSHFVRNTVFSNRFIQINTDYDLYIEIKKLHADLNRLGNYLVHVSSLLELQTDQSNLEKLRISISKTINESEKLKKIVIKAIKGQK